MDDDHLAWTIAGGAPLQSALNWSSGSANACLSKTGAGESGKSTILKQMKLIYAQGFSKTERLEWKPVVFSNVVQSFRTISEAMTELTIKFENPENEVRQNTLLQTFARPCIPRRVG